LDSANAFAATGNQVFVVGSVENKGTNDDVIVRVYDVKTGKMLWQDQFDGTSQSWDAAKAIAVTVA
jgi:TolB-like protein